MRAIRAFFSTTFEVPSDGGGVHTGMGRGTEDRKGFGDRGGGGGGGRLFTFRSEAELDDLRCCVVASSPSSELDSDRCRVKDRERRSLGLLVFTTTGSAGFAAEEGPASECASFSNLVRSALTGAIFSTSFPELSADILMDH